MTRPALLAFVVLCVLPPLESYAQNDGPRVVRTTAARFVEAGSGGGEFRVVAEPVTGNPAFLYGSRVQLTPAPRTFGDMERAARNIVIQYPELFGVDENELVLDSVTPLELSSIGSSDKVAVVMHQVADGLPVLESTFTFLFEARSGDLIAVDMNGVPGASRVDTTPRSSGSQAIAAAREEFGRRFGIDAPEVRSIEAAIVGPSARFDHSTTLPDRGPSLVYRVVIANPAVLVEGAPADAEVIVSASGDLAVLRFERQSYTAIGGTVRGNVNVGPEPNSSTNQEQPSLEFLLVKDASSGSTLATTDANGVYSIPSDTPVNAYFELTGPFATVINQQGNNARVDLPLSGPGNIDVLFNPTKAEFTSAEVAAFYWVNEFRDWLKSVDPAETKMDFPVKANVNLGSTCNAYFSGNSINFFAAGGGCTNTSYRSVCHHEEGHYANEKFNGAVSGAFHEGVADAWAYYISDDPCLQQFSLSPGCLRSGEQTSVKKCPNDGDESCHGGEVHNEGNAIASALWAVRKNMKNQFGAGPGSAAANALFIRWFQAFNDRKILNVIRDHWIALDDDNASLADLTPHFTAIKTGFETYSWPTYVIPDLSISIVSAPVSNGSITPGVAPLVTADFASLMGSVVTRELRYSTDGGTNWTTVAMTATATPGRYTATLPAQTQGKRVRWYLRSVGTFNGNVMTYPTNAPADANLYVAGFLYELGAFSFDSLSDEGFTHVNLTGTNGDQWQRSNPAAPATTEPTDPDLSYSPNAIFGTDLSVGGGDGKYEPSSSGELRTPTFDFTGSSNVILQFRRQLAVDRFTNDQATVRVNGTIVWQNSSTAATIDTGWTLQEIDISALAANNPSVQISWRILANGSTEYGGWNIDDVVIYRVDPPYPGYFETYGEGCIGSWGVAPTLTGKGPPSPGQTITIKMSGGLPFNQVMLFAATGQGFAPLPGECTWYLSGTILVGGLPIIVGLDGKQSLSFALPSGPANGDVYLQHFAIDPGGLNDQYTASNGLRIHIE